MTKKSVPFESEMLIEVRKWRKAAFEADKLRSPEERERHRARLIQKFGLKPLAKRADRR